MDDVLTKAKIAVIGWGGSVHTRKWVRALVDRNYRVKLVGLTGDAMPGVESALYDRKGRISYLLNARRAIKEIRAFKPDILHVHYAAGFGMWGLLCGVKPMVVSVWGADIIDFPSNPIAAFLVRRVLHKATLVTATSQMLLAAADRLCPGVTDKTIVIPFGVTVPESFEREPDSDRVGFCFIKALAPKYGPDVCLQAMAKAIRIVPNISLSMAGSGAMENELRAMSSKLDLDSHVTFSGHIAHNEIYSFIARHHVMVMPSTMQSESFGVAVLEAAACGRTTIASRIGGVPEVIRHNETGLLVAPRDVSALSEAMVTLARDAQRRQEMGKAAHAYVKEHYAWNRSVDMMTDLYESLTGEAKAHPAI